MRIAETVTFGGSDLDRTAHLRGDTAAMAQLQQDVQASTLLLWRGKLLVTGEPRNRLCRLPMSHPLATGPVVFLGTEENGPVFAHDISGWTPPDLNRDALTSFIDQSEYSHPDAPQDSGFRELRTLITALSARDAELAATAKSLFGWHRSHRFCAKCGHESEMAMAGWQRNCPACATAHFPRTDPVVIMLITHGNRVLMGRSPGWPEGMYSLLAGFIEPGETIEAAVRREVVEEAGVRVGPVGYLASQPWPYPSSLMIGCWGKAETDEITIDPAEIEDAQWFTREDIADSFAGRHPFLKAAREGAIAHFILWNWLADRLD